MTKAAEVQGYVKATLDAFGRIDAFHNNAGIEGRVAPIVDYDEATYDAVMGVNVKGVFLGLKYVLPVMIRQGSGSVVNTASIQLLPTTVAAVRAQAGAARPFDILPAVWIASALSVGAGLLSARLLSRLWRD